MTGQPRCIAFTGRQRCPHAAALAMGDYFTCTKHGVITLAIMTDRLSASSRRMLAFSRWETLAEGQRLIDQLHKKGGGVMPAVAAERHDSVIDAVRFFSMLYADQTGILELRTVPLAQTPEQRRLAARLRDFVPVVHGKFAVRRIDRFIHETAARRMASYFGVSLRTQTAATDRKGDAAHCQTLTALFVDADYKHLGEATTRQRLADFPIPPSIIVNSGGGLHPYWLLRTPLDLQRDYRGAQSILRRLAKGVADVVDESVSEPARILRIPGNTNFKYDPPRVVTLERG